MAGDELTSVGSVLSDSQGEVIWEDRGIDKKVWILSGVVVLVLVLFVLLGVYFVFPDDIVKISSEDLSSGKVVDFKENSIFSFDNGEGKSELAVESIGNASVKISVVGISEVNMESGKSGNFDLDGDGVYDLVVEVRGDDVSGLSLVFREFVENNFPAEQKKLLSGDSVGDSDVVLEKKLESVNDEDGGVKKDNDVVADDDNSEEIVNDSGAEGEEDISSEQFCEDKGKYLYLSEDDICNGVKSAYTNNDVSIYCCDVPVVKKVKFTDDMRSVWDSVVNSGNCSQVTYISKLESCSEYKCTYIHPLFSIPVEKGVLGRINGLCHSFEELGEIYCVYDDSQLSKMVDFLTFSNEKCGDGNCSVVSNSTGYFIDGILTEDVLDEMSRSGDCVSKTY